MPQRCLDSATEVNSTLQPSGRVAHPRRTDEPPAPCRRRPAQLSDGALAAAGPTGLHQASVLLGRWSSALAALAAVAGGRGGLVWRASRTTRRSLRTTPRTGAGRRVREPRRRRTSRLVAMRWRRRLRRQRNRARRRRCSPRRAASATDRVARRRAAASTGSTGCIDPTNTSRRTCTRRDRAGAADAEDTGQYDRRRRRRPRVGTGQADNEPPLRIVREDHERLAAEIAG